MSALLPIHFLAWGYDFGSTSFHTFIGSIAALHTLKRRDFGAFQNKVFPYQFWTQTLAPGLIAFTAPYTLTSVGIGLLAASSIGGILDLAIAEPKCRSIKEKRDTITDNVYKGDDEAAKKSGDLDALNKEFGKYHTLSLFFNAVSIFTITGYAWVMSKGLLSALPK